ncbi:hypothetical protein RRG08_025074 [Elysia crispata]|uniref:Uncharacterized protein n=1 Tax=Elysia crispata TaxID=231223 RepID=A0AAE1AJF8_9GAST|nr:hypothetical protein RRG08_025074 [Elysia crispata]
MQDDAENWDESRRQLNRTREIQIYEKRGLKRMDGDEDVSITLGPRDHPATSRTCCYFERTSSNNNRVFSRTCRQRSIDRITPVIAAAPRNKMATSLTPDLKAIYHTGSQIKLRFRIGTPFTPEFKEETEVKSSLKGSIEKSAGKS